MRLSLLSFLPAGVLAASAPYCPLLGAAFPAPVDLKQSAAFQQGISAFKALLASNAGAQSSDTAYSVSVSSAADNQTLYELHYTPPNVRNASVGVRSVNADSIYRIGSISKIFTVFTFLREVGDVSFNDPVTKYLPELRTAGPPAGVVYDDIDSVKWEDITLGNLASQISGITRDVAGDLSSELSPLEVSELGLPTLNASEIPTCGQDISQPPCNVQQLFQLLQQSKPSFPSSYSPAYSNIAFELLALALGRMTGKNDLGQAMQESIFAPLGMDRSSYTVPSSPNMGVIPGSNETTVQWDWDLGVDGPGGNVFMSTNDLATAGRAILASTLLQPAQTRRWLTARTLTADMAVAVGAPWEIRRFELPNGKIIDLYNKEGDVGLYNAQLITSPDHQLVITVMAAGPSGLTIRTALADALANTLIPAVEEAARTQANSVYAGTYTDAHSNSSVTIATDQAPGLSMSNLISRGAPTLDLLAQALNMTNLSPRLFPSGLQTVSRLTANSTGSYNSTGPSSTSTYVSRTGWRASYLGPTPVPAGDQYLPPCSAWLYVDTPMYGEIGLDDIVFDMGEDGQARAVEIRALRLQLSRQ